MLSKVPSSLASVGDFKLPTMAESNAVDKLSLNLRDNIVLTFLGILHDNGIMILHEYLAISGSPDVEHATVNNISK